MTGMMVGVGFVSLGIPRNTNSKNKKSSFKNRRISGYKNTIIPNTQAYKLRLACIYIFKKHQNIAKKILTSPIVNLKIQS